MGGGPDRWGRTALDLRSAGDGRQIRLDTGRTGADLRPVAKPGRKYLDSAAECGAVETTDDVETLPNFFFRLVEGRQKTGLCRRHTNQRCDFHRRCSGLKNTVQLETADFQTFTRKFRRRFLRWKRTV